MTGRRGRTGHLPGFPIFASFPSYLSGMPIRWTAGRMDQLENAARRGLRVALSRRGTEFIVVALRVTSVDRHDALVARLPMTGEELTFVLDEIESLQVIE